MLVLPSVCGMGASVGSGFYRGDLEQRLEESALFQQLYVHFLDVLRELCFKQPFRGKSMAHQCHNGGGSTTMG